MIRKYLTIDTAYFISVFFILLLGLLALIYFTGNTKVQVSIAVAVSFIYVCWGILHHLIHHDISFKIVVEYILIGVVGMTLIVFLVKGI